jgi:hypothetical protein
MNARSLLLAALLSVWCVFSLPARGDDDADVILLLPAASADDEVDLLSEAAGWIAEREGEGFTVSSVSLYAILDQYSYPAGAALSAEEIRLYLRSHLTHRTSGDSDRGRYLFLLSRQEEESGADYLLIPRYELATGLDTVETDSPYGFLGQETLDGGDGVVDIVDLDYSDPTLLVCRIPISSAGQLNGYLQSALAYQSAAYRRDLILAAGMIAFEGDAAYIQDLNAGSIDDPSSKVFDTDLFSPDYICTGPGHRLATFLAGDDFAGGVVYNISHGSDAAIYACNNEDPLHPVWFSNLASADLADLSPDKLNIFISIACANDSGSGSLARDLFDRSSVAVISASRNVDPISIDCALAGETTFLSYFYEQDKTLLQSIQGTRSDYYQTCALVPGGDQLIAFSNILAFNIYGDGLIAIAESTPSPTPAPSPSASPAPTAPNPTPTAAPTPVRHVFAAADFDGDGADDLGLWRPSDASFRIRNISTVFYGLSADIPITGDYNGDSAADYGVFRPSTGRWWVRTIFSGTPPGAFLFGTNGDIPVPADYDGDFRTDTAVWRPMNGYWAVKSQTRFYYGARGDLPVPADYNGDGRSDPAVFRADGSLSGIWYIRDLTRRAWGYGSDAVAPGDYNGDGTAELSVFRPAAGVWYILGSPSVFFGRAGDIPVAIDYEGDGTQDRVLYRPAEGAWHIYGVTSISYGASGDLPAVGRAE